MSIFAVLNVDFTPSLSLLCSWSMFFSCTLRLLCTVLSWDNLRSVRVFLVTFFITPFNRVSSNTFCITWVFLTWITLYFKTVSDSSLEICGCLLYGCMYQTVIYLTDIIIHTHPNNVSKPNLSLNFITVGCLLFACFSSTNLCYLLWTTYTLLFWLWTCKGT